MRSFATASAWSAWLAANHASVPGVWMKIAKKASRQSSATRAMRIEKFVAMLARHEKLHG